MEKELRINIGAFIENNGKLLIMKRDNRDENFPGVWEIPGGTANANEKLDEALKREIKEETNLDAVPVKPVYVFEYDATENKKKEHKIEIDFLVHVKDISKFMMSSEHSDFAWISENELEKHVMTSEMKSSILAYFNASGESTKQELGKETMKWLNRIEEHIIELTDKNNREHQRMLKNIHAYIADSKHFMKKGDMIRSFEAVIWAWAWMDISEQLKIIRTNHQ